MDVNGNGLYDNSEPFDDFGEPFIDANDNDTYDATDERYIDSNGNGQYDGPNGIWDGDTFVWNTIDILWSSLAVNMNVTPSFDCQDFVISDGQSCTITVEVTDSNDNPIIGGSTISIIPDIFIEREANITPNSLFPEYTIPDANRTGLDTTLFKYAIRNVAGGSAGSFDGAVNLDVPGVCTSAFQKTRTFNVTLEAPTP